MHPSWSIGHSNYDVCVVRLFGSSAADFIAMHNNSVFAEEGDSCSEVRHLSVLKCTYENHDAVWINAAPALCDNCISIVYLCEFKDQINVYVHENVAQVRDTYIQVSLSRGTLFCTAHKMVYLFMLT